MFVLGIVGSIAGGKSTVARHLQELGATWINADLIAQQALGRADVKAQLTARLGNSFIDSGGEIIRSELGRLVFGDDDASRTALGCLESVVHPIVRVEITRQYIGAFDQNIGQIVLFDIPLMFESGWDYSCDSIWCVDAEFEVRQTRVTSRGWDQSELGRREAKQMPLSSKRRLSSLVIENNTEIGDLNACLAKHWRKIIEQINSDSLKQITTSQPGTNKSHCRPKV